MIERTRSSRGFTLIERLACPPKPWRRRARQGFTLIELLVVIAIIGGLAAILIPSLAGALRSAKRARALSQITALEGAIKGFIGEYGIPPLPQGVNIGDADQEFTGDAQAQIIQILCNWDDANWPGGKRNKREIVFLDLDPKSFDVSSVSDMKDALIANGYRDPWENPYGILLDLNLDDRIVGLYGGTADNPIRAKVGVYSLGEKGEADADNPRYKTW